MITSLTLPQKAQMLVCAQEWKDIGLCTDPADRPNAEAAINIMYKNAGLSSPKIVWCGSPLTNALTISVVKASVGDSVRDSVRASVRASVRDSVGDSVGDSVWASVWASVGDSVRDSVWASVGDSVWASVRASVGDSVRASVWASVRASVGDSVRASVWASVGASVWASVRASVGDSVGDSVWASVRASVYGQHDADWLAFYDFFGKSCGLFVETSPIEGLILLAKSAGWALPYENLCLVSERPQILLQEKIGNRYQLHCDNGPSIAYPDGWKLWYIHGVAVTEQIVMRPETLTIEQINSETNAEVRRIMVERYGHEKYLRASNARIVDSCAGDHPIIGLRTAKLFEVGGMHMLDLLNSTPEPDGTIKRYVIPVDGDRYDGRAGRECIAASASTWRMRKDPTVLRFAKPEDYRPAFES